MPIGPAGKGENAANLHAFLHSRELTRGQDVEQFQLGMYSADGIAWRAQFPRRHMLEKLKASAVDSTPYFRVSLRIAAKLPLQLRKALTRAAVLGRIRFRAAGSSSRVATTGADTATKHPQTDQPGVSAPHGNSAARRESDNSGLSGDWELIDKGQCRELYGRH